MWLMWITLALGCRVRREIHELNSDELETLIDGFRWVYNSGYLEELSNKHYIVRNRVHGCAQFLPFHNTFIYDLETELIKYNSTITLPYWNWTMYSNTPLNDPILKLELFGDDYSKREDNCVKSGKFANWTFNNNCFKREYSYNSHNHLTWDIINNSLYTTTSFTTMTQRLEQLHAFLHVWVSGDMKTHHSPNDPLFYLHHVFVDKIWNDWRSRLNYYIYGWKNWDNSTVSFDDIVNGYDLNVREVISNKNCVIYKKQTTLVTLNGLSNLKLLKSESVLLRNDVKEFLIHNNFNTDEIDKFLENIGNNTKGIHDVKNNSSQLQHHINLCIFILMFYIF